MTVDLLSGLLAANLAANLAAALAILSVLALRGPVRRRFGAAMAYRLWLAPLVAGLAVFVPAPKGLAPGLPLNPVSQQMLLIFAPETAAPVMRVAVSGPGWSLPDLPVLLLGGWLAGAVIAIGLTLLAHRRGMASFGRLQAAGGRGPWRADRQGLGPSLVGVLRPRLVLPADFEARFSEREQALILAHERHHGASGDTRINGLVVLLGCLNWFNPLVHLAAFQLRVDQELACDAAVVSRFPGERRTYAEALLKSQQACIPLPLGCNWPGRSPQLLQERLTMLAHHQPSRAHLLGGGALVGALCLTAGVAAWAAAGGAGQAPARPAAPVPVALRAPEPSSPAAARPAAPAPKPQAAREQPEKTPPTTIGLACLSNNCSGQPTAGPRDPAAVAAALKAGDPRAAFAAGASADEVLNAFAGTRSLGGDIKPGSAQFVDTGNTTGAPSVRFDLQDGGSAIVTQALLPQKPGGPDVPTSIVYGLPPALPATATPQGRYTW